MANVFGRGYYTDWQEMLIGMQKGLERAFKDTCEEICKECNKIIAESIYSTYQPMDYDRTYEMFNKMEHHLTYDIQGLECQFLYDNKEFEKLTIDSVGNHLSDSDDLAHHALSDDSGNGYDVQGFMDDIISPIHNNFMEDARYYIQKNFQTIYRKNCVKYNIKL